MPTIFKFDRGATYGVLDLNDQVNYALLEGLNMRVAKRREGLLGGYGPFADVAISVPVRVFSNVSGEAALQALHALTKALDQAYQWKRGAKTDPVILNYKPLESGLTNPLLCPILGPGEQAEDMLDLPVTFNQYIQAWEINPVYVPVVRRGLLLGDEETSTTSAAAENPSLLEATFAAAVDTPSPLQVVLDVTAPLGGGLTMSAPAKGLLFFANDPDKIKLMNVLSTTGTGWSTVSLADASGGSYRRLTPSDTTVRSLYGQPPTPNAAARRFAAYASVRNNSATVNYTMQMQFSTAVGDVALSRPVVVDGSNNNPHMVYLGMGSLPVMGLSLDAIQLFITPSAGSGAGHELDVDYVVIVAIDEYTRVLEVEFPSPLRPEIIIDAAALTYPRPFVTTSSSNIIGVNGDAYLIHTGDELAALVCAMVGTSWRVVNSSGNYMYFALSATRRKGYLVAE